MRHRQCGKLDAHQLAEPGCRLASSNTDLSGQDVSSALSCSTRSVKVAIRSSPARVGESDGGLCSPLQDLVTRGAVLSGQRAQLSPAFGDLFQAPGLAVQALQIAHQISRQIGELVARLCQPIAERSRCSISGDRRFKRRARRVQHRQRTTSLILRSRESLNSRMRRIPQVVCRLQPHGLCRQRDIFRRARSDSLDLFQAEAQQVDLAGPALGLGTELSQLRLCGAILRPEIGVRESGSSTAAPAKRSRSCSCRPASVSRSCSDCP